MRDIKFRVWDKDLKLMHICGEDIHDSISFSQNNKAFYYNLQNGCGSLTENSSYVLMQYTGLKDKNGKEIYEGDIVYILSEDENATIIWDKDSTRYVIRFEGWCTDFDSYYGKDLEVIGNAYENPELLEEVK